MKKARTINSGIEAGKLLYAEYKEYIVSIIAFLVCLILIIFVLIPELQDFWKARILANKISQQTEVLKNNLIFLTSLDTQTLNNQEELVINALPAAKDYIGILSVISQSAGRSGVSVGDYTVTVGVVGVSQTVSSVSVPSIQISLEVSGNPTQVKNFLSNLSHGLPISQITNMKLSDTNAQITAEFYFKPFAATPVKNDSVLSGLSSEKQTTLKTITSWQ